MGKLLSTFVANLNEQIPRTGASFSRLPPPPPQHKASNVLGVASTYHEKVPLYERSRKTMIIKEIVL